MNTLLLFDIAKSLLLARWRQSLVAAIGVLFGVTMFIALLGFMNGLNELLDGLILNRVPHVRLYSEIKPGSRQPISLSKEFAHTHHFIRSIRAGHQRRDIVHEKALLNYANHDQKILGATSRITAQVFFQSGAVAITGAVNGIEIERETKLFHFGDYLLNTSPDDLKITANGIILGKPLAEQLNVDIGDLVPITTSEGKRFPLKVVGFFQSGLADFDKTQSYASLETVQKILGKAKGYVTDIALKLNDLEEAPTIARKYQKIFDVDAEDIQTANAEFETGSSIRSIISYAVGITLLVVAGFGIYNILNMMIYEKMDTIAILKAVGFGKKDIERIFLIIALVIGIAGGLTGLCFGFIFSMVIDQIPFTTKSLPTVTTYPVNYNMIYYFIGFIFALATTFFAGWFPAKKAGGTDPVNIIRGK